MVAPLSPLSIRYRRLYNHLKAQKMIGTNVSYWLLDKQTNCDILNTSGINIRQRLEFLISKIKMKNIFLQYKKIIWKIVVSVIEFII
jgi:hypothetical protein